MENFPVRSLIGGMGQAVAERTVLRKLDPETGEIVNHDALENGAPFRWETWAEVAKRVALGNVMLAPRKEGEIDQEEYETLRNAIAMGKTLMSGRHLQHGDQNQPNRNQEVFSNCSTSANTFSLFYLLLNGSGVGRCYDDGMMIVDWDNAPSVICVLNADHADFDYSAHTSVRDAKHLYGTGKGTFWFEVPDTREGWAQAVEVWENAAFQKIHRDKLLILDFSKVRPRGAPIAGMQNRPSSGPVPLMNAFEKASRLKGAGLDKWVQTMHMDHYFAECVLVGGARRAARMSTKHWMDRTVLDFIKIKRPIEYAGLSMKQVVEYRDNIVGIGGLPPEAFLWSSNNSVGVDDVFWGYVHAKRGSEGYDHEDAKWARKVFKTAMECAYGDGTGEPGLINLHKLNQVPESFKKLPTTGYIGGPMYRVREDTEVYVQRIAKRAMRKSLFTIVNPCQPEWATVLTPKGVRTIGNLSIGDLIWSKDGWVKVVNIASRGVKAVLEYRTNAGAFYGTDNHKIVSAGTKVPVSEAESIDVLPGACGMVGDIDPQDVMDGLVLGDGSRHMTSKDKVYLTIGQNDSDYFHSEVSGLIGDPHPVKYGAAYKVTTTVQPEEVPHTHERAIPSRYLFGTSIKARGLLRGLFSANGCVAGGRRVALKTTSHDVATGAQLLLSSLGMVSYITTNRSKKVAFDNGTYECRESYDVNLNAHNAKVFKSLVGFLQTYKTQALEDLDSKTVSYERMQKKTFGINSSEDVSTEEVFDIAVDGPSHTYWSGGCDVSNCGEVPLSILGGYCTIADVVPYHCDSLQDVEDVLRASARALIRVNTLDCLYRAEVDRTNRIGVGLTGVHEFAWKFFNLSFHDLIADDQERAQPFWDTLQGLARAVRQEAENYSAKLGVEIPHTMLTIKPSGTVSKLFGLTEGWHLPSMKFYLRWVQFRNDDPLVETYKANGYPTRVLETYRGHTIVGFPTQPVLSDIMPESLVVTAGEATPEQQFRWLQLGERYWISGAGEDVGGQISYTLKYRPDQVEFAELRNMIRDYVPTIKCCSVMPQTGTAAYEYQPEQSVTKAEYEAVAAAIQRSLKEDVDKAHIDCESEACPIDFAEGDKHKAVD